MSEDNTNEDVVEEAVEAAVSDAAAQVAKVNIGHKTLLSVLTLLIWLHNVAHLKPAEAGQVGATFNKLVAFVKAHQAAGTEEKGEPEEGVTPATTDEATSEELR